MKRISSFLILVSTLLLPLSSIGEQRYNIPVGNSPQIGPSDAPVTIIEFLDFQ